MSITGGVIGAASGLLSFLDYVSPTLLTISALAVFGLLGWAVAIYLSLSKKFVVPAVELMLDAIATELAVPFSEPWLRATLFNRRALEEYWQKNEQLRLKKIACSSHITDYDVSNRIEIEGRNAASTDASACPMSDGFYRWLYNGVQSAANE